MRFLDLILGLALMLAMGCGGRGGGSGLATPATEAQSGLTAKAGKFKAAVTVGIGPSGATVPGVDVSVWDGAVNWAAVKASGCAFAIARVSDGLGYPDSTFAGNWSGMKAAGLIRGAYQYFEPSQDGGAQASMVIAKVGLLGSGDLPVMLDVETTDGLSPAAITASIHKWVTAITAGTGKAPMIYCGSYFWDDNVQSADFSALPLVIASYGTNDPSLPNEWRNWTFHQYTDTASVPGISGQVDGDIFNGSLAQLQGFANSSASASSPTVGEVAFQANTGDLWTVGAVGNTDWHLGMMAGTGPSIATLTGGGFQVAFQANTGDLWTVGNAGDADWKLGMMAGTSPSITALPGGGFEVAFQANTGDLWTVGTAGNTDWHLGMKAGTSPSIVALKTGGFEVAFQANTGDLWTVGNAGNSDWHLGMMAGTSPSISALAGAGFEVAFQANTGDLWTVGNAGNADWKLGMMAGTSPSIVARPAGGFEVAFQANTGDLWTVGNAGNCDWKLGLMKGTSPFGG